jgi:hypothetical protein
VSSPGRGGPRATLQRTRSRLVVLALTVTLSAGCTAEAATRAVGDRVTEAEAAALAELLQRNHEEGGADFVVTAPYRDGVVLTLTGEVDFRDGVGRAHAVTTFGTDREDDVRTLFFSADEVWTGDVPGLTDALADAGDPTAAYLRRDLTTTAADEGPILADVLVAVLLRLSAESADEPESFLGADYSWQGQRSIDSRLATGFGLRDGRTVAVSAADDLLLQSRRRCWTGPSTRPSRCRTTARARWSCPPTRRLRRRPTTRRSPRRSGSEQPGLGLAGRQRERAASSPDRPLPEPFLPEIDGSRCPAAPKILSSPSDRPAPWTAPRGGRSAGP